VWAVALLDLAKLNLNVPVGVSGRSNLLITLVDVEGTILAEATSALVVDPAVVLAPEQEPATDPELGKQARGLQTLATVSQRHSSRVSLSPRGKAAGRRRETSGARQYRRRSGIFQARCRCRFSGGATLLATTYDPVELQRLKVLGVVADSKEARKWYGRARELGAPDDPSRFLDCKC
jgi:hypothetical protein